MFDKYVRGCIALYVGEILDRELVRRRGLRNDPRVSLPERNHEVFTDDAPAIDTHMRHHPVAPTVYFDLVQNEATPKGVVQQDSGMYM